MSLVFKNSIFSSDKAYIFVLLDVLNFNKFFVCSIEHRQVLFSF